MGLLAVMQTPKLGVGNSGNRNQIHVVVSMKPEIIELTQWLESPPGAYLLDWERTQFDRVVSDIFGFHALQLGLPELDALQANRMPHKWLAGTFLPPQPIKSHLPDHPAVGAAPDSIGSRRVALLADSAALPFPENSLDLVVLPHTLELSRDPHSALREVARVLVPEGRVVISGFNPASLWGLRQRRDHFFKRYGYGDFFLPKTGDDIGYWRLRDWLRLLNFEVESARFGCYRPALSSQQWLDRFDWMDAAGKRWWPILGAAYFLVAVKRVRGTRLLEPGWKARRATAPAAAAVASKETAIHSKTHG